MITLLSFLFFFFPSQDKIVITESWMRTNAKGMASALYLKIENTSELADTLYKVDCDLAEKVEIHETYSNGDVMGMRKIDVIVVHPNSTFELKPGAFHIMLMKLRQDIKEGDEGKFILYFKNAGKIEITAKAKLK